MRIYEKVKHLITDNSLLSAKDSVLIALSGGPDSVALLHILSRLKKSLRLNLNAIYINHGLRPRAAAKEELFCTALCQKFDVNLRLVAVDIKALSAGSKKGIEEAARDFRYEQFEKSAAELDCNKIALGHHFDDRVETILFRFMRGTGPAGLKGIPVSRGKIIRPLFNLTKQEILDYLKKNNLKYCIDKSNSKTEFSRNYIRNRLLPEIRAKLNPAVDRGIISLSEIISEEEFYLENIAAKAYLKCVTRSPGGKLVLASDRFAGYDLWVQRRVIRRCIAEVSKTWLTPSKEVIGRVIEVAAGKKKAVSVPGNLQCHRFGQELYFYPKARLIFQERIEIGSKCKIEELGATLSAKLLKQGNQSLLKKRQSPNVIVDFGKVRPPLLVRNIRTGDRFCPLGLKGSKKVSDYLVDRKVSRPLRDEVPVVTDRRGIIWLVGYEIDERVKMDSSTTERLKIGIRYS
ncbi:MAG: tRNA lysidine(34) synthetase TilS [candidate division Zixibacteria bacterium]|nr:tRNA lysidine(34) synthetase TilS [candidate division Zixibacteria bacterium]